MKNKPMIPSVNFHLWEPCNFSCKFCFATFQDVRKTILPKGHLPKEEALKIIDAIAGAGFSKITFVGGEPTLCPWIGELIIHSKIKGLTTMIVTNGSGLTEEFLSKTRESLDWVVVSIDSIESEVNKAIGRSGDYKLIPDKVFYLEKIGLVKKFGIKLKINTVVNKHNFNDTSLSAFVDNIKPKRWKIFKALRVKGQNDKSFNDMKISNKEFKLFLSLNKIHNLRYAVAEDNEEMTGTYAMIDPAGRFFDNTNGSHTYSKSILEVGVDAAMKEVSINYSKFLKRGGLYKW